jgi:hypothetical protein
MKPYDQLTPRQQFFRQNIVRVIIYSGFLLGLYWCVNKVIEIAQEKDAELIEI